MLIATACTLLDLVSVTRELSQQPMQLLSLTSLEQETIKPQDLLVDFLLKTFQELVTKWLASIINLLVIFARVVDLQMEITLALVKLTTALSMDANTTIAPQAQLEADGQTDRSMLDAPPRQQMTAMTTTCAQVMNVN
jgi:hypothetical protein